MNRYLPLLMTLALVGCGGGGGGSTPPATTASTPTITPTPNSAVGQGGAAGGPINGTALKTQGTPPGGPFPLKAITATFNTSTAANGGGLTVSDGNGANDPVPGTVSMTFDASNKVTSITYKGSDPNRELTGLDGQGLAVAPTTIQNPLSVSKITKELIQQQAFINNTTFNKPAVVNEALNFSSFGVWATSFSNNGGPHDGVLAVGVFAHGSETPVSAVPKTGTANFTGDAAGFASVARPKGDTQHTNSTLNGAFDAAAAIGINFGTGAVASSITGAHFISGDSQGTTVSLPDLNGTGNMNGNAYSTSLASSDKTANGNLNGKLYGPTAQETAGTFSASGPNGFSMIGAFGAKR